MVHGDGVLASEQAGGRHGCPGVQSASPQHTESDRMTVREAGWSRNTEATTNVQAVSSRGTGGLALMSAEGALTY